MLVIYLSMCFTTLVSVNGYKSGAPVVACDSMTPGHNVEAQVCWTNLLKSLTSLLNRYSEEKKNQELATLLRIWTDPDSKQPKAKIKISPRKSLTKLFIFWRRSSWSSSVDFTTKPWSWVRTPPLPLIWHKSMIVSQKKINTANQVFRLWNKIFLKENVIKKVFSYKRCQNLIRWRLISPNCPKSFKNLSIFHKVSNIL